LRECFSDAEVSRREEYDLRAAPIEIARSPQLVGNVRATIKV
jgi:hypothetical protein